HLADLVAGATSDPRRASNQRIVRRRFASVALALARVASPQTANHQVVHALESSPGTPHLTESSSWREVLARRPETPDRPSPAHDVHLEQAVRQARRVPLNQDLRARGDLSDEPIARAHTLPA